MKERNEIEKRLKKEMKVQEKIVKKERKKREKEVKSKKGGKGIDPLVSEDRPFCVYREKCTNPNPDHWIHFQHTPLGEDDKTTTDQSEEGRSRKKSSGAAATAAALWEPTPDQSEEGRSRKKSKKKVTKDRKKEDKGSSVEKGGRARASLDVQIENKKVSQEREGNGSPEEPPRENEIIKIKENEVLVSTIFMVKAIKGYKAKEKKHISFSKGSVLRVLVVNESEGMYYGIAGTKLGWFPSYYVTTLGQED